MKRAEFLNMCQRVAVLPSGVFGIKLNVPQELLVEFKELNYYPCAYKLSFDKNGNVVHTAILHDLMANSVVQCDLHKVKKGVGK